ncbi:hypothetical protein [Virgisporangium ochraceum]|nr:hypothetical protein [Virgisporangium ochraceum]
MRRYNLRLRHVVTLLIVADALVLVGPVVGLLTGGFGCAVRAQFLGGPATALDRLAAGSCGGFDLATTRIAGLAAVAVVCAALAVVSWLGAEFVYPRVGGAFANWLGWTCVVGVGGAGWALAVTAVAGTGDRALETAQVGVLVAWTALVPAAVLAALVTVTVVMRALVPAGKPTVEPAVRPAQPTFAAPVVDRWARNYVVPGPAGERDAVGICLSGGGIRSASFAMGAMQAFAANGVLKSARYLATVSGGGYLGGAFQRLRAETPAVPPFAPGSAEEDHVRRHGRYIADGAAEWVAALGSAVRNIVLGLGLLFATLMVTGTFLGWAYAMVWPWSEPVLGCLAEEKGCGWIPAYPVPTRWAVAVVGGAAFVVWMVAGIRVTGRTLAWRRRLERCAEILTGLAVAVVLATIGLPTVAVVAAEVAGPRAPVAPGGFEVASVVGLVTAVTTLWNMIGRRFAPSGEAPADKDAPAKGRRLLTRIGSLAGFATRALLGAVVVLALGALALTVLGASMARSVAAYLPGPEGDPPITTWWFLSTLGGLALVVAVFDQTRMSLHPFYKRRLATAFRLRRNGTTVEAAPWGRLDPMTMYGTPPPAGEGPELVVCAAANVSGQSLAPPGRRAVPFVFTDRYIGGPQLGYLSTPRLEEALEDRTYRSDITLLAAMAISGAAFASAMGRMSGPFNALLALANARLGVWLPNPRYFHRHGSLPLLERMRSALPRVRRVTYYVRELLGSYPPDERFVYVSDGGHYENLGLVELLRRRCTTIYCVDATGDSSIAQTLAEAATLAYEELGVDLTIDGERLARRSAGAGVSPNAQLRSLEARYATQSTVRGRIRYPDGTTGRLIVGKAVLTRETPYEVRAYAVRSDRFPSDSTADQWFDVDQFDAYRALGWHIGRQMAPPAEPPPTPPAHSAVRPSTTPPTTKRPETKRPAVKRPGSRRAGRR